MFFITFLRHGESEGNADGRLQGQGEFPLTKNGIHQVELLAARWQAQGARFDRLISSPLKRASQTAAILAGVFCLQVELDPIWIERDFGNLEGQKIEDLLKQDPPIDFHHPFAQPGGIGESELDLYLRACQGVQSILRRSEGSYLVVSHGAILNMALYALGIAPHGKIRSVRFRLENTAYFQLRYDPDTRQWWLVNLVSQTGLFMEKELIQGENQEEEIK